MKRKLLFAVLATASFFSAGLDAAPTTPSKVEWVRSGTGYIGFRNHDDSFLNISSTCTAAREMRWEFAESTDIYKRVMSVLMTATASGRKVSGEECGCVGDLLKACDIAIQ